MRTVANDLPMVASNNCSRASAIYSVPRDISIHQHWSTMSSNLRTTGKHVGLLAIRALLCVALLALGAVASAAPTASFVLTPACPAPTQQIEFAVYPGGDVKGFQQSPTVSIDGNVITILVLYTTTDLMQPLAPVWALVGPLAVGTYSLVINGRESSVTASSVLLATGQFTVESNPPVCSPATLTLISKPFQQTLAGQPYSSPVKVGVLDESGRPVPGIVVRFERYQPPQEGPLAAPAAASLAPNVVTTDALGVAQTTAVTAAAGVSQFVASFERAGHVHAAYFILGTRDAIVPTAVPLVEYARFASGFHYFMTSSETEMADLDNGVHAGWYRTGGVFLTYPPSAVALAAMGAVPVCRFYGRPEAGLDSHFYTASATECRAVQDQWPWAWQLEDLAAFFMVLPDFVTGNCPPNTQPVYRFYNGGPDVNHRYVVDAKSRSAMLVPSQGSKRWTPEGYGPDAVAMCAPNQ